MTLCYRPLRRFEGKHLQKCAGWCLPNTSYIDDNESQVAHDEILQAAIEYFWKIEPRFNDSVDKKRVSGIPVTNPPFEEGEHDALWKDFEQCLGFRLAECTYPAQVHNLRNSFVIEFLQCHKYVPYVEVAI